MNTVYEERAEKLFIGLMTRYACPIHVHEQAELVVITSGTVVMTVGETQYTLEKGDAAVIFPLVPHSYDELRGDHEGVIGIFPPDIIPEYAGTFHGLMPVCPILRKETTGPALTGAIEWLRRLDMGNDLALCVAYLHVLLACVMHQLTYRPVYDFGEQDLGKRVIRYLSEHALEPVTLASASHTIGISVSHLSHFFSEQMHTSFRGFINAIRIEKARMLMRNPALTLTEICDMCGYTNIRTFRRAFQSEMKCLPSDYLMSLRSRFASETTERKK